MAHSPTAPANHSVALVLRVLLLLLLLVLVLSASARRGGITISAVGVPRALGHSAGCAPGSRFPALGLVVVPGLGGSPLLPLFVVAQALGQQALFACASLAGRLGLFTAPLSGLQIRTTKPRDLEG